MDWEDVDFAAPPPGEEGVYMSHAGGFDEAYHMVLDQLGDTR